MSHSFHPCSLIPHVPSFLLVILHPQSHSFLPSCALSLPTMSHPSLFCSFTTRLTQPSSPSCAPSSPTHPIPLSHAPSPTTSHRFSSIPPSLMSRLSFHCSSVVHPSHPTFLCCHLLGPILPFCAPASATMSYSFMCSTVTHCFPSLPVLLHPLHIPSLFSPSFQSVLSSTLSHPSLPCHTPPLPTMSPPALLCSCILHVLSLPMVHLHHPPHPIPSSCTLPSPTTSHPSFWCSSIALHIPPSCLPVTPASHPSHLLLLHPYPIPCYPHPPPTISSCLLFFLHFSTSTPSHPSLSYFASSFSFPFTFLLMSISHHPFSSFISSHHHSVLLYILPSSYPCLSSISSHHHPNPF